ncbi:MAG: hypothetical protein DCF25_13600 [Leptolyngbya foveolarum]|uniref:Carrier domain-containing protein n=1 Tax=Leptolyngbya foveolarum TaxID=47253 RepID=A0A2W4U3I9_9CYAN|nr:MAG: hypothetical protein DCF25_13600 [Leptolyngbya foveolarum]
MNNLSKRIAALSQTQRSQLEAALKQRRQNAAKSTIPVAATDASYPLSFAQRRLWFLHQLTPHSPLYNLAAAIRLRGQLRRDLLARSLNEVRRRHTILRSRFVNINGQPRQVIPPWQEAALIPLDLVDLQNLSDLEQASAIQHHTDKLTQHAFDLSQDEPVRFVLLRLAENHHRLLVGMHHIVSDGWSKGLLIKEVATLYQAYLAEQPSPLADLLVQYTDFSVWQQQQQTGSDFQAHASYWKETLSGSLPLLELPIARPNHGIHSHPGRIETFELSAQLSQSLRQIAQQEGATLFMTLLTAFNILLYRYSGQSDLCIGIPTAGRATAQLEDLIGCFINPVVVRSDLSGDPCFKTLLRQVRETATEAYSHADFPFDKLVEELQPDRETTPLFQVMFTLQNVPKATLNLPDLDLDVTELHSGTAKFDLTLAMEECASGITGTLEYRSDRFDQTAIVRLKEQFQTLLQSIVTDLDRPLSALNLLPAQESQQLLTDWNQTAMPISESTIHQLFEKQVEKTPEAIALTFQDSLSDHQHLTYRELNQRANQLAHHLQTLGVKSETRVGLCVTRSPDMLIGLLGILKAGGAYVPLDPSYLVERLTFMVQDSQIAVLVMQSQPLLDQPLAQNLAQSLTQTAPTAQIVDLERDRPLITQQPQDNLKTPVTPQSLAYLIYTSGSTGRPKGVMIEHRSVVNFLQSLQQQLALTPADHLLAVTTLSFDISVLELLLPLSVGASVTIASQAMTKDAIQMIAALEQSQSTVMQATPSTWQMLLSAGWRGKADLTILSGGEALSRDLAEQLLSKGAAVWNLYGPTETTIWSTVHRVTTATETIPIGRPIANTQIYLLDERLQPVPMGGPGELYIGGAGLARGYWQQPDLTAARFIENPFKKGDRLYKTGDLVRYQTVHQTVNQTVHEARQLPCGMLEHLGRLDHQVKLRGHRIELGEIEAILRKQQTVTAAIVIAREDEPGDQHLVAYAVFDENTTSAALRSVLRSYLPEYMVPAAVVRLERLPLTPNGKVDRKALPRPDYQPEPIAAFAAPKTPVERQLIHLWASVLKASVQQASDISTDQSFFDLGGHSLLATQLMAQIREEFQVELPLRILFDFSTIADLAQQIETHKLSEQSLGSPTPLSKITRVARQPYRHRSTTE